MEYRQRSPDIQSGLAQQALADVVSDSQSFFEDVSTLSPLESIEHFCRSHQSFQRLCYAQGIAAAAKCPTAQYPEVVETLLPLVQQLARDPEAEIRATAVKQLPGLGCALFGKDAEHSMRDIEGTLLVCAQQCALDDDEEVCQAAILAFQQLVQLLPAARATAGSKRAVDRLESQGSDDGTLAAVRLLAHTVAFWTPEALKRHVPRYIGRWTGHRDFAVREAAATCMSLVLPAMPLRLCHQVLLPAFYQLSRDQNWRVRRACAMDLPRLAAALQKRPAHASTQLAAADGSSSSWQQEVEADQTLGCCSSRPSSCLGAMQRLAGDLNGSHVASSLAAASGPQRNRSFPSLVNRSPATTAQIMTKHPMHSSLIMDGLLSSSSSCNSMPGSPSGCSESTSLAQDAHDDACSSQAHRHSHHHQQQQQEGYMSDSEQPDVHVQQQPHCRLEQVAELLHDCWCALRQCMELLTADSSHWVKVAALSGLGPFLLQLPPCQLGMLLLGRFTSMAGSTVVIYEGSVALACAQAFGQLAVLLGPDRWPDMRDAWHALQASRDPAVLCEVVSCMPQLMAALGPVLTHREMFPALAGLLQSHLSWIAGQLVLVMADLLPLLPPSGHELLLKTLPQLAARPGDRTGSWRVRRDLALQLGRLAAAAGPDAIENSLWPTAMSLCCDPIAAVRTAAASQVGHLLAALPSHMLQSQLVQAESCAACCSGRLGPSPTLCPPRAHCRSSAADAELDRAAAAAGTSDAAAGGVAAAAEQACNGHSSISSASSSAIAGQGSDTSSSPDSMGAGAVSSPDGSAAGRAQGGVLKPERSKSRSSSRFAVRFSVDEEPSSSSSVGGSSRGADMQPSRPASRFAGLVADQPHQHSSSLDFDEMELPSALAPAPVGCFSALSDSSSDESDADDAAGDGSGSSGLSSSGSHSSDGGSHHSDSSTDESSDDGSDADGAGADGGSCAADQCWPASGGTLQQEVAAAQAQQQETAGVSSSSGDDGHAASPATAAASDGSAGTAAATPPPKPLYAMHPAMMPVGALTAAAAAGSASRAVPISSKGRQLPSRAKSTGDLQRLQSTVSAPNSADAPGPLGDSVVARLKQQESRGLRQLPDSLPNGLLGADGGSSDDDFSHHGGSSGGGWARGLPQPAHAAPQQYLPVLVEYFGCSSSHQERQLFVPLVMGLLAACHNVLSCAQQAVLLDRLEALAHDSVPGVRYAVAAALADVRAQAAALTGQQEQAAEQEQVQEQGACTDAGTADLEQSAEPAAEEQARLAAPASAAGADSTDGMGSTQAVGVLDAAQQVEQQEHPQPQQQQQPEPVHQASSSQMVGHVPKGAHPLLGYQAYVRELASVTSSGSSGGGASAGGSAASTSSSNSSKSPAPVAAAVATGMTAGLPPRSSTSPAVGRHLARSLSDGASGKQQPAATTGAQRPGHARAGNGSSSSRAQPAAAPANAAGAGAAGDAAKSAEWLMKLSNCQQLERLMTVVALTTGPL